MVLDIVQAIGMAPGLTQVRVYIGQGLDDANLLNSMASENIAKQISSSWSWFPDDPQTDDVFFEEFAAQGQSFFDASGDLGAYDPDVDPYFYPAEDAYVTAVGGTHLTTNGAGGTWASEVAWDSPPNGSGGGISPDGIAIPSWQSGLANTSNGGSPTLRNVPDVAMEGDFDNYLCSMGYCEAGWAGTSFAAPRWAGFMALVNQQAVEAGTAPQGGVGFINPPLYAIGQGASYSNDLHDITSGNNDTDNQPVSYSAVSGYDLVTGWGSPTGPDLIDDLAGPQAPGFWIIGSPATVSLDLGSSSTTTFTVTDAGGFTGNVTLAVTSPLPTGVTASWGANPTASTSVLTLTASSTAPASTAPLTITGTSGNLTATTSVTVAVHTPTFALSASPYTLWHPSKRERIRCDYGHPGIWLYRKRESHHCRSARWRHGLVLAHLHQLRQHPHAQREQYRCRQHHHPHHYRDFRQSHGDHAPDPYRPGAERSSSTHRPRWTSAWARRSAPMFTSTPITASPAT